MAFGLIDDKLHGHPKFVNAGAEAAGIWLFCHSWVCDNLTNGFIPRGVVERYCGSARKADQIAQRLITCGKPLYESGLWDQVEGGYQMHDYLDHNPSADEVKAKREQERLKKDRWRNKKRSSATGQFESSTQVSTHLSTVDSPVDSRVSSPGSPAVSHAHAHAPFEKESNARTRVNVARLKGDWGKRWPTKLLMPSGEAVATVAQLVEAYADATGEADVEALIDRAMQAFMRVLAAWSFEGAATPETFIRKWQEIQTVLAGRDPAAKRPAARAAAGGGGRKFNDGIGAQPVTREE